MQWETNNTGKQKLYLSLHSMQSAQIEVGEPSILIYLK